MKKWTINNSKKVLDNKFYNVRKDSCVSASGKLIDEYYVKEGHGSAMIFALTSDDKVIVEEQYRHGIQQVSLDLPCGGIEKGETPKQAATRELLEETGYEASDLKEIAQLAYSPADSEEWLHIFLVKNITINPAKMDREPGEEMNLHLVPKNEILTYIKEKKISCVLCVAAILLSLKEL